MATLPQTVAEDISQRREEIHKAKDVPELTRAQMYRTILYRLMCFGLVLAVAVSVAAAQKKRAVKKPQKPPAQPTGQTSNLTNDYVKLTKEYKTSLEKLLALYEPDQSRAEQRLVQAQALFKDGLISQAELDKNEAALNLAKEKINGAKQQIATADMQIAQALVEVAGENEINKMGPIPRGGLLQTGSFIRYTGAGAWSISNAWKVQKFFADKFGRPLPIAVFGQGGIHDRWRLDHHNAMDISLKPDDPEGQALMNFLRSSGIPFSAFRVAIPNVATGPHIHIGMPSHRY